MGTRHLTAVQVDGEYKVAQYGQWDGYPSGAGKTVLDFLTSANIATFRKKVKTTRWLSDREIGKLWESCGAKPDAAFVSMTISNDFGRRYPELSRDTGADILQIIMDRPEGLGLQNSIEFSGDGLFCEWAYVIDLDVNQLEVYAGFGKEKLPDTERFAVFGDARNEYQPVRLVATYRLSDLPTVETMSKECKE